MACTLYDAVAHRESLYFAWQHVRHSGLLSPSEPTKQSIRAFETDVHSRIDRIAADLHDYSFHFGPARAVLITRVGKEPRPLVVSEIPDRIVQRSLLDVLQAQPAIKAYVEQPHSFGGVPGGRVEAAIRRACELIHSGAAYYVSSDIRGFFTKIPRQEVLITLLELLPDSSLVDLLEAATSIEIANMAEMGGHMRLFPGEFEGVAQGCCLSPLLGNVLLHAFDEGMNEGPIATLRYIDDFLILGPDRKTVSEAFGKARRFLREHGLEVYLPAAGSGKAAEGHVRRGFDFLGCRITPKSVEPSGKAREAFIGRVEERLDEAAKSLKRAKHVDQRSYDISLVETLSRISHMIQAWTQQYRFCNPTEVFRIVDTSVDRLIARYLGTFFRWYKRERSTPETRRRMLGVWLAADGSRYPILPLGQESRDERTMSGR